MNLILILCVGLGCFVTSSQASACTNRGGTCKNYKYNVCPAGYERGLCSGNSDIRCCLRCSSTCLSNEAYYARSLDHRCKSKSGRCMVTSNYCAGNWQGGLCGGPSSRKCCVPSGGTTTTGPCTLVQYSTSRVKGLNGKAIRIEPTFRSAMNTINTYASQCGVTVYVTSSYRKDGSVVPGAIVPPASKSNHKVGHAIDMNLSTPKGWCNSACLAAQRNSYAKCFTDKIQSASGLRWGEKFSKKDPVHIDDGLNIYHRSTWDRLFVQLQSNC